MRHNLPTHTKPPGDSHSNADDETDLANSPKSRFSEVAAVRVAGEVSLGPGLGCIASSTLDHLTSFHGYLATGVFIGLQMLALGERLLGVDGNERIHVECETYKCLPDTFQYLAGCTIGNKGLIVRDTGKIAVTITRHTPPGENAPGVRIVLDAEKTERFPKLHRWHMNTEKVL
jgi:formylmethanofuran dehydrogenase subunit E